MTVMVPLKLTAIGGSVALVLPEDVQAKLNVAEGDTVYLAETSDGYRLTAPSAEVVTQIKIAREVMAKRRSVLQELAK